ncbi:MAG: GNAT family N-acetyltransferase [Alphaproteobacteria bacterium]|nr:GNAT family N-acetyltransferase [Alphaproteobacteria bacterium]
MQTPSREHCVADGGQLELSIIDTLSAFEELRPEWDALMAASGRPDQVFQQHAWIWHWWNTYVGDRDDPVIIVGRRNGRLAMVIPLVVEARLGVRTLTWMGDPVSQYSDVLIAGRRDTSRDILRGLRFAAHTRGIDLLAAGKVREGSALAAAIEASGGRVADEQIAPAMSLVGLSGLQDIESRFSSKMRRDRRRKRKHLEQAGRLDFKVVSEGSQALEAVECAISFKFDWIEKHAIVSNTYADSRFAAFWRSAAGSSEHRAGLAVAILNIDGRPAAIEIGLRHKGVHFAHIGAFDIAYEKLSPGAAQMDALFDTCIAEGVREYDMLAPNAAYKQRLGDRFVVVRDYVLPVSSKGRACDALRLTDGRTLAKAALTKLPAGARRVIKSTLGV